MIVDQKIKKLDKSAVQLTLTIARDAAQKEYSGLLNKYVKDAVMPGFRRGKVPVPVLEKKFGDGLKAEALQTLVDKALHEVFETIEEKPLSYSQPEIIDRNITLDLTKDFTFTLQYDTFPAFGLPNYKGIEIEQPVVEVTKKDEDRELDQIREQNALVLDKASGKVAQGDTVTVNYVEVGADGNDVESTRRQDFVFTVGSGYNYYKIDDDIVGWKKDDEKTVSKTYAADFETSELAGTTKSLKIKVTAVKEKKLPDLNDDLAQDVSEEFKTLDDLRKNIADRLSKTAENAVKQKNLDSLLEKVAAGAKIDLPESMILAELDQTWRNFASNSRIRPEQLEQMLGHEGKHKMQDQWRPQAEDGLRKRLVMEKILEAEKIECTPEELDAEVAKQAEASKISLEEAKDYFDKNGFLHYLEHDVRDRKLADFLLGQSKIKKGKKISYLDLIGQKE
jgi:trigger factor